MGKLEIRRLGDYLITNFKMEKHLIETVGFLLATSLVMYGICFLLEKVGMWRKLSVWKKLIIMIFILESISILVVLFSFLSVINYSLDSFGKGLAMVVYLAVLGMIQIYIVLFMMILLLHEKLKVKQAPFKKLGILLVTISFICIAQSFYFKNCQVAACQLKLLIWRPPLLLLNTFSDFFSVIPELSEDSKEHCCYKVAVINRNLNLCEETGRKSRCYRDIATNFRDPFLCEEISEGKDKNEGYCGIVYKMCDSNYSKLSQQLKNKTISPKKAKYLFRKIYVLKEDERNAALETLESGKLQEFCEKLK